MRPSPRRSTEPPLSVFFRTLLPEVAALGLSVAAIFGAVARAEEPRPLLVTVDDLPISSGRIHPDPQEREAITREMLAQLDKHGIHAVGLVTWNNVRGPADLDLLRMWLDAGHELGNHSYAHLDYSRVSVEEYVSDIERSRTELAELLGERGLTLRFFRFPMLHEGDTEAKLATLRDYLDRTGQRNLPVTIDNQDWSFEEPWVRATRDRDASSAARVAEDYHAAMRISVRHHERTGDELYDRALPQILLLHAGAVGATQWDRLFSWLETTGHGFATVDRILADPVFEETHGYVGPRGLGLWDRLAALRLRDQALEEIETLLREQTRAWNRGDLEAFCSVYADDAVFLSTTGLHVGRRGILERYRSRYASLGDLGTLSFEIVDFRPATGTDTSMLGDARSSGIHGAALAARWNLAYEDREDATGLTLIVFRRTADSWEIVQDASM